MLAEHAEATGILIGQVLLHRVSYGSTFAAELQATTHLFVNTDIELGDMDMFHDGLEQRDSRVKASLRRIIDIVVSLHTDTIDGHALILHLLYHIIYTVALVRINSAVVVIE